jgi:CheY-like chemotaxis protein
LAVVLVVEDDEDTRELFRIALEDAGHTVLQAGDGDLALSLMRTSLVPLVVLLDLYLLGSGDNPVIKAMEADPSLAVAHRVIVLTAGLVDRAEQALQPVRSRLAGFLAKPFHLSELLSLVAEQATGSSSSII